MRKQKEKGLTKLREWITHTEESGSANKVASFSYPEDAKQSGTTLIPVVSKTYQDDTVVIDGRNFINCEFRGCTIHWNGNDFIFTSCQFDGAQKLASTVPQVAGAMKLAKVCGLLNESTESSEADTGTEPHG